MTNEQFQILITKLDEINKNILSITKDEPNGDTYNLNDLFHSIQTLDFSVKEVKKAIEENS